MRLQVHVAIGDADATLAVYNALRGYLPELAALAANAPFYAGRDTGFASVRPLIGTMLPRQGVPPQIPSWAEYAEMLRWTGRPEELVVRAAPAPVVRHAGDPRVRHADDRARGGRGRRLRPRARRVARERDELDCPQSWRIAENRWRAARHGLDAELTDLVTGEPRPVRALLRERLELLAPVAERIGCAAELATAGELIERNGATAPARGRPRPRHRVARRSLPQSVARPSSAPLGARNRTT